MVKPIVEGYGGRYIVRAKQLRPLAASGGRNAWLSYFPDRSSLNACFDSEDYKTDYGKRTSSVNSQAVIVPGIWWLEAAMPDYIHLVRRNDMKICDTVHQLKVEFDVTPQVKRYVYVYIIVETGVLPDWLRRQRVSENWEYIHKIETKTNYQWTILNTFLSRPYWRCKVHKKYACCVWMSGERDWIEDTEPV